MLQNNQIGPTQSHVSVISIATYLVSAISILTIGVIIFNETDEVKNIFTRGEFFWHKLIWVEILFFVFWYFGLQMSFSNMLKQRQQTGGAIFAISEAVSIACLSSFALLSLSVFFGDSSGSLKFTFFAQVLIIVLCLWKVMVLSQARILQNDGLAILHYSIVPPKILAAKLLTLEKYSLDERPELSKRIKSLREKITYSLPSYGNISRSTGYTSLISQIDQLIEHTNKLNNITEIDASVDRAEILLSNIILEIKH